MVAENGWKRPRSAADFRTAVWAPFWFNFGSIFWWIHLESRLDMDMYGKRREREMKLLQVVAPDLVLGQRRNVYPKWAGSADREEEKKKI
ncbi:hypothetical protein L3X38_018379 [Prunus dulcis]|uniref:Uncharacterized protein n=1 Tax=Prunus dulcis TaxID=3755 RepID=A0AAD4WBM6_PRUDU|nr:hypothetical protein L3X38_018379 [Prunus dulcis]